VIGIFVSDLLAFPFANEQSWRILFSVTGLGALAQIICYPFLIESPRWLLSRNRKSTEARHIIKKLRGLRYEHEVEIEVAHFISASHVQACDNNDDHTSSGIALVSMLMDKQIRRLLTCSLVLQMAQQFCGINAVFYYSTMLFDGVLENPLLGTTIVAGVNVLATWVALILMENSNRRTLLLWSAAGMLVSSVALVICLLGYFSKISSLFWVIAYVSFFEIGLGPM
jgi:SP family facilitated glucose transporter-like MFS transporter 3